VNIKTVADNLRNTIAGKEQMLAQIKEDLPKITDHTTHHVSFVTSEFLKVNIDELKRILQDVEQCHPEWNQFNCPYTETCHRID